MRVKQKLINSLKREDT